MRQAGKTLAPLVIPELKNYFQSGFEVVSTEEDLMVPITDFTLDEYNFKGFIDLVVKTPDGKYHVIDWKTCSWGWDARRRSEPMTTYQLTLYKKFFCQKHDIDESLVETHFALLKRTAKSNQVELFRVTSGKKKTSNALKLLNQALININKGNHVKNRLACKGTYGMCEFYNTEHCTR